MTRMYLARQELPERRLPNGRCERTLGLSEMDVHGLYLIEHGWKEALRQAAHLAARTFLWIFPFFMMTTRFLSGAASRSLSCSGSPATTSRSA